MVVGPELQNLSWKEGIKVLLLPASHSTETEGQQGSDLPILVQFPNSQYSFLSNKSFGFSVLKYR